MTPWEFVGLFGLMSGGLSGLFGLMSGGLSGAIGFLLAYFEACRWWRRRRMRRARRRLLAMRVRAANGRLDGLGEELGRVEFAWPESGVVRGG